MRDNASTNEDLMALSWFMAEKLNDAVVDFYLGSLMASSSWRTRLASVFHRSHTAWTDCGRRVFGRAA